MKIFFDYSQSKYIRPDEPFAPFFKKNENTFDNPESKYIWQNESFAHSLIKTKILLITPNLIKSDTMNPLHFP